MSQYPNEKDPHPNWVAPQQGLYTSRDGAPAPPPGGYASTSQYQAPPQGYYPPPQAPPPDYGYVQTHPQGYAHGPHDAARAAPGAGPSSQDGAQSGGMSLGAFFGNKGPPPMWQRAPPTQFPYNPFPPMCLISNGKDLSNGFPELPPPCQLNPHPFATHDVAEEDWKRFLADVKKAGSLSPAQRIKSNVIPMVTGMSLVTGFMATFAIEKKMKYKNRQAAGDLVDHWNHYFFGPRRMEVVLCQASERLSGRLGAAPVGDPHQQRMAHGLRQRVEGESTDDDSSEEGPAGSDRHTRRAGRRERRAERREERAERRERKARGEDKEPYELVVTAL